MNKPTVKLCGFVLSCAVMLSLAAHQLQAQTQTQDKPQPVEGTYNGEIIADGQSTLPFILIIKRDGEKLTTEVKEGGDINITGITLDGENVRLAATYQGNPFELPGKLTAEGMGGKWEAGGYSGTWSAKKRAEKK